ncbi:flagellar motor protein MotB [Aureivirga sp. CE67]|uniref:OmpA/MotB family protein n=1 Tax=Aureivirga sp. CE67 TaxID=1788983 RepID=UPI0018C9829F|nr:OmpA family protein [Aureivirga sp. CE67]
MRKLLILTAVSSLALTSCVSSKKYSALQEENNQNKEQLTTAKANLEKCLIDKDKVGKENQELAERVEYLKENNTQMLSSLTELSVLSKREAENVKRSLEKIENQDGYIRNLQDAIARKDSLNLQLVLNLKGALGDVNDEDIQIEVEGGAVFISLSDKLLFRTAGYTLNKKGIEVLGKVAKVVNDKPDIEIMVEGFADSRSYAGKQGVLVDNWDLSVKRATSVVRILEDKYKVDPERMIAAGRGKYHPVASNDTADGRAKNRRTKIVILPKFDQFFELLEKK